MVTNTGLSGRGCSGAVAGRQVDADIDGGERRRHHEDDQQHQHDVDERRDVDLVLDLEIVAAGARTKTHGHAVTPPRAAARPRDSPCPRLTIEEQLRRGVAQQRAIAGDDAGQMIVDHDRRDRGDEPERGRQQRLGDAGRDHREVGGVRFRKCR